MITFLLSFGVICVSVLGLAAGVLMGRPPIKGSCGGLACGPDGCGACPKKAREREDDT